MSRLMTRRQFGLAATGLGLNIWPVAKALRAATGAGTEIRFAIALRAAFQCAAWIGTEAGIFRQHGMEVTFPTLEAGGPQALAGTLRGDWDFCQTGDVPIVEGELQGQDPVLILTPTELHEGVFVMAKREITKPEQLARSNWCGGREGRVWYVHRAMAATIGCFCERCFLGIVPGDLCCARSRKSRCRLPAG